MSILKIITTYRSFITLQARTGDDVSELSRRVSERLDGMSTILGLPTNNINKLSGIRWVGNVATTEWLIETQSISDLETMTELFTEVVEECL
jgi:hypothetical protein